MATTSRISRPIEFHEGQVAPQEAARIGWLALREVMRSWCIVSREGLTQWLRRERDFRQFNQAITLGSCTGGSLGSRMQ